jgi:hypothetical protein
MKQILRYSILLYLFLIAPLLRANPVPVIILNELQVDSSGWILELQNNFGYSFDGCYLTTSNDTAYLKSGLQFSENFLVITQNSLMDSLCINPAGDVITLYDSLRGWMDQMGFGNLMGYSRIAAPLPGQSVCVYYDIYSSEFFYYLDNSPTFGYPNDSTDARGNIAGYVTDSTGVGIEGVEILYGYNSDLTIATLSKAVYTDSSGYFIFNDYAKIVSISFGKENFNTVYETLQVWPDSTVAISAKLDPIVGIKNSEGNPAIAEYQLLQNFPNPFNPVTAIEYFLPQTANVRIDILNVLGQRVRILVAGQRPAGSHRIIWDGKDDLNRQVPSGVYIYQLTTGKYRESRKMLLLR